jgi:hypothetical protein
VLNSSVPDARVVDVGELFCHANVVSVVYDDQLEIALVLIKNAPNRFM